MTIKSTIIVIEDEKTIGEFIETTLKATITRSSLQRPDRKAYRLLLLGCRI